MRFDDKVLHDADQPASFRRYTSLLTMASEVRQIVPDIAKRYMYYEGRQKEDRTISICRFLERSRGKEKKRALDSGQTVRLHESTKLYCNCSSYGRISGDRLKCRSLISGSLQLADSHTVRQLCLTKTHVRYVSHHRCMVDTSHSSTFHVMPS